MNQFAEMRLLLEAKYGDVRLDLLEEVIFYKALENEKVRTKNFYIFSIRRIFFCGCKTSVLNTILLVCDTV